MHNLFKTTLPIRVTVDGTNYTKAAGTGDTLTSNTIDTQGFSGVSFLENLNTLTATAVLTWKVQHSDDNSTWADVAGTAQTPSAATDSNKQIICGIYRPMKRYVRVVQTRATANIAIDSLTAFLTLPNNAPVVFDSTTASCSPEFWNSPLTGTA